MVFFHDRSADAATGAGGHFDKAIVQSALLQVVQSGNTVFNAVHGNILIARHLLHGLENASGGGEQPGSALGIVVNILLQLDVCFLQHPGQLLEGHNLVHIAGVVIRLILLGQAGADEYHMGIGHPAADIHAVRLHGGDHIRQIGQCLGKVLLDQQIHRVAAGGDQHIRLPVPENVLVHPVHIGGTDGCFLRSGKAQLPQRLFHGFDAYPVIGDEGGGNACYYRLLALQQHLYRLRSVGDLLGVLGTDYKALTAQDAFVAHDVRLVAGKADGLDRTVPDAFIAIFTVCFA